MKTEFPPHRDSPIRLASSTAPIGPSSPKLSHEVQRIPGVAAVDPPQRLAGGVAEIERDLPVRPAQRAQQGRRHRDPRPADGPGDVQVTGFTAHFIDTQSSLVAHLPVALAIVAVTTFVVLFLITGSVVLPLKALLMNVLTLSAVFGILVLIFQDGRFEGLLGYTSQGAIEQTMPLLLFAVAFGLSTDYGVFLLSRIKEARDGGASDSEAVAIGLERTGRIVTAAALLFAVAIGAFVDLRDHLHQGERARHGARGADRRQHRPRPAGAVADGAARQVELVGAAPAAPPARRGSGLVRRPRPATLSAPQPSRDRRPASARPSVTSSACSRSAPTGSPLARRVIVTWSRKQLGDVKRGRLAGGGRVGGQHHLAHLPAVRCGRTSSAIFRSSGSTPSIGDSAPPSTW